MNSAQEHALRLLDLLLAHPGAGKQRRGTVLLACQGIREGYARIPDAEFCSGWACRVGPHFASALDMRLDRRMRNKKPYYIWTQGTAFCFREGYAIHRADGAGVLQVQSAKAATPAKGGEPRDPGFARIQFYAPSTGQYIWQKGAIEDMSQDELVRILITGKWKE